MSTLVEISNTIVRNCNTHHCFCGEKFKNDRLEQVLDYYLKLNVKNKQNFIALNVKRESDYISWSINSVNVCRKYFMNLFNIKSAQTIYRIIDKKPEINNKIHWKSHSPEFNKAIENFIMSFKPEKSHYNYMKCPNRLYLSDSLSLYLYKLYKLFAEKMRFEARKTTKNSLNINNKNNSIELCNFQYFDRYRKKLNVGFDQMCSDRCNTCVTHDLHLIENIDCSCKTCKNFDLHLENYVSAREKMKFDSNSLDSVVVSTDTEKTFTIPKLCISENYFASGITIINQTFCEIGSNPKSFCYISNDIYVSKGAREHLNFILLFLKSNYCDKNHVIIWMDNCCSQNKNWLLFSNLIAIINDNSLQMNKITFKYLESGHTYNSCDSIHSNISRKLNTELVIYTPNDCIDLIKNCCQNINVIEVLHSDIYLFNDVSTKNKPFILRKIKQFEVRKGF